MRISDWSSDVCSSDLAVGQRVMPMALPQPLLRLVARGDRLVRGARARLTPDRVAYFCHPDWTIDPEKRPDPALWQPEVPTSEGLAATARWYRAKDRKSVVLGKSVSVRFAPGGRRTLKKKKEQ